MRRFVSYAKIMQTESIDASLLASYADVQLILCANICNFIVWLKNCALVFFLLTNCLDLSRFFLFVYHDFNLLE